MSRAGESEGQQELREDGREREGGTEDLIDRSSDEIPSLAAPSVSLITENQSLDPDDRRR